MKIDQFGCVRFEPERGTTVSACLQNSQPPQQQVPETKL